MTRHGIRAANRILLVDSDKLFHSHVGNILAYSGSSEEGFDRDEVGGEFFSELTRPGVTSAHRLGPTDVDSAFDSSLAIALAREAAADGAAYLMAVVNAEMPRGEGVTTVQLLQQEFPELAVVVCMNYEDDGWVTMSEALESASNVYVLRKPIEPVEILQIGEILASNRALRFRAEMNLEIVESQIADRIGELRSRYENCNAAVAAAFDGHIVVDQRGEIVDLNPAAARIFDYREFMMKGKAVSQLIPSLFPPGSDPLGDYLRSGTSEFIGRGGRYSLGRARGEKTIQLLVGVIRVESRSESPRFLVICRDVTEQLTNDKELRQHRARLEELVRERTAALAEATRLAAEASSAKSMFLANMSHELRTPLNAILGYSEFLLDEAEALDRETLRGDLERINIAGKHLLELIDNVLDLSKIEAGKMTLHREPFEVSPVVEEVCNTIAPLLRKNRNRLNLFKQERLGMMNSDGTKLKQILYNLLSNASKFTEGGIVSLHITCETTPTREPWLRFEITDTGVGMSPPQINHVFDAFTQGDPSTTRKYGGTGLGLTICQRFCRLMGGSIHVRSEVNRGSTFVVRLPRNASPVE